MPSRREGTAKDPHIVPLFEIAHQEMQNSTIVPDRVSAEWTEGRDVGGDPHHTLGSRPQAILRLTQSRGRKVQDRKVRVAELQEVIHEQGSATAHIEDGSAERHARIPDRLEGASRHRLEP
jgi:hypothetical protein